jgi:hypothetical protein
MVKRSLLFLVLMAVATGGYAQDAWKGHHSPTLVPQKSGCC